MSEPLLRVSSVHTHVGAYHLLHGVDLEVPRGEITLLLVRNGAGKTTTLRTIMGLWRATSGSVLYAGKDIARCATSDIARRGVAYVPENMGIFSDLSVKENMLLAARGARTISDLDQERLAWVFGLFPAVDKFWNSSAGKLSGGQKQMVALARAIIEPRELLLVDEPSKGLAPAIVDNIIGAFRQLKAKGVSILLVEQNVAFAKELGDGVAVMDNGKIIHTGPMRVLVEDRNLQYALLGLAL